MLLMDNTNGDIVVGEDGYLEESEKNGYINRNVSKLMSDAVQLNKELYQRLSDFKIGKGDNVGVFLIGSLIRVHKDYQSVVILLSRGLQSQAKSIARNMMEKVFYMKAISENPEYIHDWINRQIADRNSLKEVVKGGYTCLAEQEIAQIDLEKEDINEKLIGINEWAGRADLIKDYKVIFKQLCFDTHHSGVTLLEDFEQDENGYYSIIDIHPHFDEIDVLLFHCIEYLVIAIKALANYIKDDCSWTEKYMTRLNKIADV